VPRLILTVRKSGYRLQRPGTRPVATAQLETRLTPDR
jgi:hypothetical protein